jgi:hypothetical protein
LKTKDLVKTSTYLPSNIHQTFIVPFQSSKILSNSAVETVLNLRNIVMAFQPPTFMMTLSETWPLRKLLTQDRHGRER